VARAGNERRQSRAPRSARHGPPRRPLPPHEAEQFRERRLRAPSAASRVRLVCPAQAPALPDPAVRRFRSSSGSVLGSSASRRSRQAPVAIRPRRNESTSLPRALLRAMPMRTAAAAGAREGPTRPSTHRTQRRSLRSRLPFRRTARIGARSSLCHGPPLSRPSSPKRPPTRNCAHNPATAQIIYGRAHLCRVSASARSPTGARGRKLPCARSSWGADPPETASSWKQKGSA